MRPGTQIDEATRADMEARGIDVSLSEKILSAYNRGEYDRFTRVEVSEVPEVDGTSIIDFSTSPELSLPLADARERLAAKLPGTVVDAAVRCGKTDGTEFRADASSLTAIGLLLLPTVSYGILNGGSASSYADTHRNRGFSQPLFELLSEEFGELAAVAADRPKGIAPAYVNHDRSHGGSFLELKMRNTLISILRSRAFYSKMGVSVEEIRPEALTPIFQMSSDKTAAPLNEAYARYPDSPLLHDLVAQTGVNAAAVEDAVQPLLSAFTHSEEGRPKRVFTNAHGNPGETLPMPGGHGQCFAVLAVIFRSLAKAGKRFVTIGNVDNLGYLVDPREIAYLALTGRPAGFDFSYRTPVDVKGGILVCDQSGHLNCADIGAAISRDEVDTIAGEGRPILFNTAAGVFDLDFLVANLNRIIADLPVRFSDQNKDAGRYSQAEQVTWEVLGMLDDLLVFSVRKSERFLAAKLLLETLMTSGLGLDDPAYPTSDDPVHDLKATAQQLNDGLVSLLRHQYAMQEQGGAWFPRPAGEVSAAIEREVATLVSRGGA